MRMNMPVYRLASLLYSLYPDGLEGMVEVNPPFEFLSDDNKRVFIHVAHHILSTTIRNEEIIHTIKKAEEDYWRDRDNHKPIHEAVADGLMKYLLSE